MKKKPLVAGTLAAVCALTAVIVPVAEGTTAHHSTSTRRATNAATEGLPPLGGPGGPGGPGAIHSVSVVPNKARNGFITVTTDGGTLQSVDGSAGTITIEEGIKSLKYQTATVTVPSGSTVILDGKSSSLGNLVAGDHVTVSSSSEGTTVFAADSSFHPEGGPGHGGPPPAGSPAPGAE